MSYSWVISLVSLAGCRKDTVGEDDTQTSAWHDSCVIHPNECNDEFVTPLDLDGIIDHPTCNSVSSTPIGHCESTSALLGETRQCAITSDACDNPESWQRPSQNMSQYDNINSGSGCTVLQDFFNEGQGSGLTHYISCKGGDIDTDLAIDNAVTEDGAICVAAISECNELAGAGVIDVKLSDPNCDCSNTRVGACFRMGDVNENGMGFKSFCAVSAEVCEEELGLTYRDVNQLMRISSLDCRLCDARTVEDYKLSIAKDSGSTSLSNAAIAGIAIGSALGVALLLVILQRFYSTMRVSKQPAAALEENNDEKDDEDSATLS